jgi:hypothetical protein
MELSSEESDEDSDGDSQERRGNLSNESSDTAIGFTENSSALFSMIFEIEQ